jgi:hypothetical protein
VETRKGHSHRYPICWLLLSGETTADRNNAQLTAERFEKQGDDSSPQQGNWNGKGVIACHIFRTN